MKYVLLMLMLCCIGCAASETPISTLAKFNTGDIVRDTQSNVYGIVSYKKAMYIDKHVRDKGVVWEYTLITADVSVSIREEHLELHKRAIWHTNGVTFENPEPTPAELLPFQYDVEDLLKSIKPPILDRAA